MFLFELSWNDENPLGLLRKIQAPKQKPCHTLFQKRRVYPDDHLKDRSDLSHWIAREEISIRIAFYPGSRLFQSMGQIEHSKITVTLSGIIPPFRDIPTADELLMKALVVEENPGLLIVIDPQILDRFDFVDKLRKLPDEKRGMEIADDHNGTASIAVFNFCPYAPVMGFKEEFPHTPPSPDFPAMHEEHLSRIVLGKGTSDLPVKAESRDVYFDRAGDGIAGRGSADPEGVPVAASVDGLAVTPDAWHLGPGNFRPDALPGVTDPDGNPFGHKGSQRTDKLTLATSDGGFIVQDFEHL